MSRTVVVGSVVLAGVALAGPAAGTQTSTAQDKQAPSAGHLQVTPSQPDIPPQAPLPTAPAVVNLTSPQVICGMTVWRVDPSIDPDIQKQVPETWTGAKIRRIVAQECVPGASAVSYSFSESIVIKSVGGIERRIPAAPAPSKKPPR